MTTCLVQCAAVRTRRREITLAPQMPMSRMKSGRRKRTCAKKRAHDGAPGEDGQTTGVPEIMCEKGTEEEEEELGG